MRKRRQLGKREGYWQQSPSLWFPREKHAPVPRSSVRPYGRRQLRSGDSSAKTRAKCRLPFLSMTIEKRSRRMVWEKVPWGLLAMLSETVMTRKDRGLHL